MTCWCLMNDYKANERVKRVESKEVEYTLIPILGHNHHTGKIFFFQKSNKGVVKFLVIYTQ